MAMEPAASEGHEWDAESYHQLSDPQCEAGLDLLNRLTIAPDATVIDAGCGTGRLTRFILARVPRGHVVAIDRSLNMLASAQQYLGRFGNRVEFLSQDLEDLAYHPPVDCIYSNYVMQFVRDHNAAYGRFATCLRPGGMLAMQFPCANASQSPLFQAIVNVCARPQFSSEVGDDIDFL